MRPRASCGHRLVRSPENERRAARGCSARSRPRGSPSPGCSDFAIQSASRLANVPEDGQVRERLVEAEHVARSADRLPLELRRRRAAVERVVVRVQQHGRRVRGPARSGAAASASGRRSSARRRGTSGAAARPARRAPPLPRARAPPPPPPASPAARAPRGADAAGRRARGRGGRSPAARYPPITRRYHRTTANLLNARRTRRYGAPHAVLRLPPDALALHVEGVGRERRLELGHRLERELRPREGTRALRRATSTSSSSTSASASTASASTSTTRPPTGTIPVAERDGGAARAAHDVQDRAARQRDLAPRPPAARRGGVGAARRRLRRAHHLRLRARDRLRVPRLLARPDPVARPLLRGARPDHQGVDGARPLRVVRRALQAPLRQPMAAAVPAAAPAGLEPVARLATRRSTGRRRTTTPTSRPTRT